MKFSFFFLLFFLSFYTSYDCFATEMAFIVGKDVNIRNEANINAEVLVQLQHGTAVKIHSISTKTYEHNNISYYWYQISFQDQKGWCLEKFLNFDSLPANKYEVNSPTKKKIALTNYKKYIDQANHSSATAADYLLINLYPMLLLPSEDEKIKQHKKTLLSPQFIEKMILQGRVVCVLDFLPSSYREDLRLARLVRDKTTILNACTLEHFSKKIRQDPEFAQASFNTKSRN